MKLLNFNIIKLTIYLILGILIGFYFNITFEITLVIFLIVFVGFCLSFFLLRQKKKIYIFGIFTFLAFIVLGIVNTKINDETLQSSHYTNSENDTEVAAGYISNQISKGKDLEKTLENSLKDLDGFYTFIAGTKDGFALLRDEIACKPAVVAETKDYVAVASEFQAMAHLPNVNSAKIFEPKPGVVYHW